MYTNGNIGNTFDQYKISYILLCIIIIIMQEVYITCPVFISTLIISVKGDLPCFAECCSGPGGVFHHACEGWSTAFCGALICNEDETADDHTLSNTPSTSVGCTLAPEGLGGQTTNNCRHWRWPKQREHSTISWSRLACSDCVWQALVCC